MARNKKTQTESQVHGYTNPIKFDVPTIAGIKRLLNPDFNETITNAVFCEISNRGLHEHTLCASVYETVFALLKQEFMEVDKYVWNNLPVEHVISFFEMDYEKYEESGNIYDLARVHRNIARNLTKDHLKSSLKEWSLKVPAVRFEQIYRIIQNGSEERFLRLMLIFFSFISKNEEFNPRHNNMKDRLRAYTFDGFHIDMELTPDIVRTYTIVNYLRIRGAFFYCNENISKYKIFVRLSERLGEFSEYVSTSISTDSDTQHMYFRTYYNYERNYRMFYKYFLAQDLDGELLNKIYRTLVKWEVSRIIEKDYESYRELFPSAPKRNFLPDKRHDANNQLPLIDGWNMKSLERLYLLLIESDYINESTSKSSFCYIFGVGEEPEDYDGINWIGGYNGKPGQKQVINLLLYMGYDVDYLRKGIGLQILNRCVALNGRKGENFKTKNFPSSSRPFKEDEKLKAIVEELRRN